MRMKTNPDNTGKNGPMPSIELPPPIPDRSKENAKDQKNVGRAQKPTTEKIGQQPEAKNQNPVSPKTTASVGTETLPKSTEAHDDGWPSDVGKKTTAEKRAVDPSTKPSNALPWLMVPMAVAILALVIWGATSYKTPQPNPNNYSGFPTAETDVGKQNPLGGGDIPTLTQTQPLGVEKPVEPQASAQTNSVSSENSNQRPEPIQQEQTPVPVEIPGPSFDSSQQPNPGNRVSEDTGKSGKDFRWGDNTYKVSHHDWITLNNEKEVYNAQGTYILRLEKRMSDLEKQIETANWLKKKQLTKLYDSLSNEDQEKEAEHNTEWEKANEMVSSAAIQ